MNLEAQGLLICKFKSRRQGLNPDLWYCKVHVPSSGESHHRLPMAVSVWFWVWLLSSSLHILQGPAWWPSSPSDNQHSLLLEHCAVYRAGFWAQGSEHHRGLPREGGGCSESWLPPEGAQGGCLAHGSSELTQLSVTKKKQGGRK